MAYSEWFPCSKSNKPYSFDTNTDVRRNHIKVMKIHQYGMTVEPSYIFKEVSSAVIIRRGNRKNTTAKNISNLSSCMTFLSHLKLRLI